MQIAGHINGFDTLIGLAFLSVEIVVGDLRCVEPSSGEAHGLVGESRVLGKLKTKVFKCDGASGKSYASILIDSYIGVHMAIEVSFDGASS